MTKLLVIVGATGHQGRSVINHFQQIEPTWKLRGLTRNPSSESAIALANSGVEVVKANLDDVSSLKAAFAGANYIFAYTDSVGIILGPEVMGKFVAGEIAAPVGAESYKIELQQGKNVADAAATVPGLERLVWSLLTDTKKWSKGKYNQIYHFDAKAAVLEYIFSLDALAGKASMVLMGSFMHNIVDGPEQIRLRIMEDKTAVWQQPYPGDLRMPWIDVQNDTGAFVKALIDAPAGTQVLGVGEWMTNKEFLDLWSSTTGVPSRFVEPTLDEADTTQDPTGLSLAFLQTALFIRDFGFAGGDPAIVSPDELEDKGIPIPRTKVSDFLKRRDWSNLLAP